jgi:hypothetical protein
LNYGPPRALIDRAVAFKEVSKETEGEPTVLRWAKGLMRFAETSTVTIFPDELIAGRQAQVRSALAGADWLHRDDHRYGSHPLLPPAQGLVHDG